MAGVSDLTCVYYSANRLNEYFHKNTLRQLKVSLWDIPAVSVTHKPLDLGHNIVVDLPWHHLSIYKQALIGAKAAGTKFIALAEDDVLYSPEHFKYRPRPGKFAYNIGNWGIYTWAPNVFSYKGRRAMLSLICERDLFIEAMEERFAKWPDDSKVNLGLWAEPGKYEEQLGVTVRQSEQFYTNPANVVFSHERALAYGNLGRRKRIGMVQAIEIPHWGRAEDVTKQYAP